MTRKKMRTRNRKKISDDAFVFDFGVVAKVDQQSDSIAGRFQVIVDLCPMRVSQFRDRLDFENDFFKTDEIRDVPLLENTSLVTQLQLDTRLKRQRLNAKLDFQTHLIDRLNKSASILFVDFKTRAQNLICLSLLQQRHVTLTSKVSLSYFCSYSFRVFRGSNPQSYSFVIASSKFSTRLARLVHAASSAGLSWGSGLDSPTASSFVVASVF